MKTLIVYRTKYGSTEKCAAMLSEQLNGEVELLDLKGTKAVDFTQYDHIIIGGSIYMGRIQKEVKVFCLKNADLLKKKKVGVFICCMQDGDAAEKQLQNSFPNELIANSIACEYFGGEFIFQKMGAIDRFIAQKVSKTSQDTSNISQDKILRFAKAMNHGSQSGM